MEASPTSCFPVHMQPKTVNKFIFSIINIMGKSYTAQKLHAYLVALDVLDKFGSSNGQ